MNRRELVQRVIMGSSAFIIMPSVLTSCEKDPSPGAGPGPGPGPGPDPGTKINIDLSLAENSALNVAGGSKIVQSIIVAKLGDGSFVALDSICTHEGCTIGFNLGANNFPCPCHGSVYAINGSVLNGPTTKALKSHATSLVGTILTITV